MVGSRWIRSLWVGVLVAVIAMGLAACGGDDPTPTPTSAPVAQSTPTPIPTPTPEPPFFEGKAIRMTIGFTAGSGADIEGRFIASRLSDFIPGNPKIIVTTSPTRASYAEFLNRMHAGEGKDGLSVGYGVGGSADDQLSIQGVTYKFNEFRRVFELIRPGVYFAHDGVPYNRMQDAVGGSESFKVNGFYPSGSGFVIERVLKEKAGIPIETIFGIRPTYATRATIMERRDVDVVTFSWYLLPIMRPGWLSSGEWRPFAISSDPTMELIPNAEISMPADIMNTQDLVPPHYKDLIATLQKAGSNGILFDGMMMAPGAPEAAVAALVQATADAFADPEFGAAFTKAVGNAPTIVSGPEAEAYADSLDIRELDAIYREWVPTYKSPFD